MSFIQLSMHCHLINIIGNIYIYIDYLFIYNSFYICIIFDILDYLFLLLLLLFYYNNFSFLMSSAFIYICVYHFSIHFSLFALILFNIIVKIRIYNKKIINIHFYFFFYLLTDTGNNSKYSKCSFIIYL